MTSFTTDASNKGDLWQIKVICTSFCINDATVLAGTKQTEKGCKRNDEDLLMLLNEWHVDIIFKKIMKSINLKESLMVKFLI